MQSVHRGAYDEELKYLSKRIARWAAMPNMVEQAIRPGKCRSGLPKVIHDDIVLDVSREIDDKAS